MSPSSSGSKLKLVAAPAPGITPDAPPEPASLDEIFRTYAPYVAAIGLRLLGRVDEIEDLVQDVFLKTHRGLGSLREPAALKGWLATVTVRSAQRRLAARRVRMLLHIIPAYDYAISTTQSSFNTDDGVLVAEIYAKLDRLPVAERVAFTLRRIEGEPLEKVAELTGTSLATVKRRVSAAEKKLQELVHG